MKTKLRKAFAHPNRIHYSFFSTVVLSLVVLLGSCGKEEELVPLRPGEKTVINTRPPAFIATDSVKLSAEILEVGRGPIEEAGFILSNNPEPAPDNSTQYTLPEVKEIGPYSLVVKKLDANQAYYYRFYVKESGQILYGPVRSFTTSGIAIYNIRYLVGGHRDESFEGSTGNELIIEGRNFSNVPSENVVKFGDVEARVSSSYTFNTLEGSTALSLKLPDNVAPGLSEVTVTRAKQTVKAPKPFRVLPGHWKQLKNLDAGTEYLSESFSLNGKGYMVGRLSYSSIMYEYTPTADNWRQLTDFRLPNQLTTSFTLSDKNYFGVGVPDYTQQRYHVQLYAYNPATGVREQKQRFPVDYPYVTWPYSFTGFAVHGEGYMGGGSYTVNNDWVRRYRKDFYKYTPATDSWTRIADFPGTSTADAVTFVINGIAYLALASHENKQLAEVWAYDAAADTWTRKRDFPGQLKTGMAGFTLGAKGYLLGGIVSTYPMNSGNRDFWEYDPATDTWREIANFDNGTTKGINNCFVIGGKAYAVVHDSYSRSYVWEFTPAQ